MNKQAAADMLKSLQETVREHSLVILAGISIAGTAATAVIVVEATPKALRMVDSREIEDEKRLIISKIIKITWRCYIPTAVAGICSAACIIGASSASAWWSMVLVTVYTTSKTALKEYKDRAVEVVGPKKEQAIWDAVAKEQLEQVGVPERKFIPTGWGETLCFDPLTNACLESDYKTPRGAKNVLNKWLWDEVRITVNDFLEKLGLLSYGPTIGDNLGWDVDKGWIEFGFSSQLVDGILYLVIGHRSPPRYIDWRHPQELHLLLWRTIYGTLYDKEDFTMEETSAKVTENEELEDITEVEETEESGSVGALVAGVVGSFLVHAMISGVKRPWGFAGAKLAEREAAERTKAEVVGAEYTEVAAEDSDEEDFEK